MKEKVNNENEANAFTGVNTLLKILTDLLPAEK